MGSVHIFPLKAKQEEANTRYVGIVLFLASWAVLFAGLFFSYGLLRLKSSHWPPPGVPALPLFLPGIASVVLVVSSVSLSLSISLRRRSLVSFIATIALGALFLVLQSITWFEVWEMGLQLDSGAYGGVFYLMTTFHAVHIVGGLFALLWFLPAVYKNWPSDTPGVEVAALFWHFLGVVWLLMFVGVYVV